MKKSLSLIAGLIAAPALADTPVLTVYTYDSFISEWGPGPVIETAFEEECSCDLQFVGAGDGAALLSRVLLEGPRTDADIILGLDTNLIARARESGLFAPHNVTADLDLPVEWNDPDFLPYDWGYFAFVAPREVDAPASFRDLAESDIRIIIEDPRSSTPGLGLLLWVKTAYPDAASEIWHGLSDNIVTVTPGWSEAYGLFLEGEADAVLSYTTSPAYHLIAEGDDSKTSWAFEEGNYLQVEVAAKLAGTDVPDLADQFMEFLIADAAQSAIPTTNWMYPARTPAEGLPEGFETLAQPVKALLFSPADAQALREEAVSEWRDSLAR